jgi:hypothetical protein
MAGAEAETWRANCEFPQFSFNSVDATFDIRDGRAGRRAPLRLSLHRGETSQDESVEGS